MSKAYVLNIRLGDFNGDREAEQEGYERIRHAFDAVKDVASNCEVQCSADATFAVNQHWLKVKGLTHACRAALIVFELLSDTYLKDGDKREMADMSFGVTWTPDEDA